MSSTQRQPPSEVSHSKEEDVSIKKTKTKSRLMPNDTRQNLILSQQFFSNILSLSSEHDRKMARFDFERTAFLKNQRRKAETVMPGLLPYIEHLTNDLDLTSSRNDYFSSPSMQSFASRSLTRSDSTLKPRQQSAQKSKTPQIMKSLPASTKLSDRQERINRLAQPKGHRLISATDSHIRSNTLQNITVHNLLGKSDDMSSPASLRSNELQSTANDKRFHRLVYLFSDVYERQPSNLQTVQSIIQSNTSLKGDESRWQLTNILDNHRPTHNDQFCDKTDSFLIDASA